MRFPYLFRQVHGEAIFVEWLQHGKPPFINVIPRELLGELDLTSEPDVMPDSTVTIVTVRCWVDQGTFHYEAARPADLKVAQDWSERHKDTPVEAFKWTPLIAHTPGVG